MKNKLSPIHPGNYLQEILEELNLSARKFAQHIGVSPMRISLILRGMRPVNADMALRLEKALGQSSGYWMNLQIKYDIETAKDQESDQLAKINLIPMLQLQ